MEDTHPVILCLGEAMAEFVREGGPDSDTYRAGVGGDTSNAAIAAARQGASVGYMSALGDDRFGDRIMRLWQRENINVSAVIRDPKAPTGIYFVDPDPAERHFSYFRSGSAASLFELNEASTASLESADILHLSGITLAVSETLRASAFAAIHQVRASGGAVRPRR